MIQLLITNIKVKKELFLADYIGMFILITPLVVLFLIFLFYVVEVVYLRNYKKPLVVFTNVKFLKLKEEQKQFLVKNFHFYERLTSALGHPNLKIEYRF